MIDGFTGDQRFFLGFAQIWRTKFRDEALRKQLLTESALAGHVARVRAAHEQRRVHEGLQREARRQDVPRAGGSGEDLVERFNSRSGSSRQSQVVN